MRQLKTRAATTDENISAFSQTLGVSPSTIYISLKRAEAIPISESFRSFGLERHVAFPVGTPQTLADIVRNQLSG